MYKAFDNLTQTLGHQRATVIQPQTCSVQYNKKWYDKVNAADFMVNEYGFRLRACECSIKESRGSFAAICRAEQNKPDGVALSAAPAIKANNHKVDPDALKLPGCMFGIVYLDTARLSGKRSPSQTTGPYLLTGDLPVKSVASKGTSLPDWTRQHFVSMFKELDGNRA